MSFHDTMFWILAVVAVGSAGMILLSRSIVHMAFWLLTSLAGFAGFYLLLGADFLGFMQVLVYIGGVLILFLFGVMLTHRVDIPTKPAVSWRVLIPGFFAGLAVMVLLVFIAGGNNWLELPESEVTQLGYLPADGSPANARAERPLAEPTAFGIGQRLMSTYILPFEVVSILLLVAMVGATYIARGKSERDQEEEGAEVR